MRFSSLPRMFTYRTESSLQNLAQKSRSRLARQSHFAVKRGTQRNTVRARHLLGVTPGIVEAIPAPCGSKPECYSRMIKLAARERMKGMRDPKLPGLCSTNGCSPTPLSPPRSIRGIRFEPRLQAGPKRTSFQSTRILVWLIFPFEERSYVQREDPVFVLASQAVNRVLFGHCGVLALTWPVRFPSCWPVL
jgi:hypothetical protein